MILMTYKCYTMPNRDQASLECLFISMQARGEYPLVVVDGRLIVEMPLMLKEVSNYVSGTDLADTLSADLSERPFNV